jgi:positive regulator of sigma E activity
MISHVNIVELGEDDIVYARYIKPLTEKAATSRKFWNVKERSFPVKNPQDLPVQKGDFVEISVQTGQTIGAAFLVFMVPLILFLLAYAFAGIFLVQEGLQALAGVAGLGCGLVLPAIINHFSHKKNYPLLEKVLTLEEMRESIDCDSDCASCGGCG